MSKRGQKFRLRTSALLEHVVASGRKLLVERLAIDGDLATEIAREWAHELAREFGGQLVYFPKDLAFQLTARDRQLWEAFNGTNHDELARRFGLSLQQVYKIVDLVRREELARRQGRLFALDDQADKAA